MQDKAFEYVRTNQLDDLGILLISDQFTTDAESKKAFVNARSKEGLSRLHVAAANGFVKMVMSNLIDSYYLR